MKISSLSAVANSLGGRFTTVYFLHGDTRRGIQKYIEENEKGGELATVLLERNNVVGQLLDKYEYRVLKEEWLLREK